MPYIRVDTNIRVDSTIRVDTKAHTRGAVATVIKLSMRRHGSKITQVS